MKILLINNLYEPQRVGGAERSVQLLAEGLKGAGHEPIVATLTPESPSGVERHNGVTVHRLPLRNLHWPFAGEDVSRLRSATWYAVDAWNPLAVRDLRKVLDRHEPDLVHTHNLLGFSPAVWRMVSRREIPLVHTIRDYYLLCLRSTMFRGEQRCESRCWDCSLAKSSAGLVSSYVDTVVGISHHVLRTHREHGLLSNVTERSVIRNPVEDIKSENSSVELSSDSLRLGFIGQIEPHKGLGWLLEQLEVVNGFDWELLVAGEDSTSFARELKEQYTDENVRFLGFRDPSQFFRKIDLLVVPSLWEEPMGRVVIEAYQHGTPVLSSNRGGLPEIVKAGRTGELFDPDLPSTFHEALGRLVEEGLTGFGDHRDELLSGFEQDEIVRRHEDLYTRVRA